MSARHVLFIIKTKKKVITLFVKQPVYFKPNVKRIIFQKNIFVPVSTILASLVIRKENV